MLKQRFKKWTLSLVSGGLTLAVASSGVSYAAGYDIADVPLYLGDLVKPNIMFTMDDSGSMYWAYIPDTLNGSHNGDGDSNGKRNNPRGLAANLNKIHYNPNTTYPLPVDANGTEFPNATFNSAWDDGYAQYLGNTTCTVNLSTSYRAAWKGDYDDALSSGGDYCLDPASEAFSSVGSSTGEAAFYYVYYPNHPDSTQRGKPTACDGTQYGVTYSDETNEDECYKKVVVGVNDDANGNGGADEKQNFANWYSYYRLRKHLAKAGIGRAFAEQGTGIRVGYGAINKSSSTIDGVATQTVARGIRDFEDKSVSNNYRTKFFELLYGEDSNGSTPLRRAADDVGKYFQRADAQGPWSETPGISGGSDYKCQQSFHIIMSDGYWNSTGAGGARNDDVDSTDGPTITGPNGQSFQFKAGTAPFYDGDDDTLADVAMYYWNRDLRLNLDNEVPFNNVDPAFWQHLVTFTISLGLVGSIDPDTAFNAVAAPEDYAVTWPDPTDGGNENDKIDDMLHAAVNSRGGYFTASEPVEFAAKLKDAINEVKGRTGSSASVVLNSNALYADNGTKLYQARFDSGDWTGQLLSYPIISTGPNAGSLGNPIWDAANKIPSPDSRLIVTYDDDATSPSGQPFRWDSLTTAQKLLLDPTDCAANATDEACDGDNIVDYIRGEQGHTSYRIRTSLLGDLVHSAPVFVGSPNFPYPDDWGKDGTVDAPENLVPYSGFKYSIANQNRAPMIYAGANDGMLHAISATTGKEIWAFLPNKMFPNLKELIEKDYDHKYFVDGGLTAVDAFFGGTWHTVLVGAYEAGGQGIFALDITTVPSAGSTESSITAKVLWEFTDTDDADMGYSFSRPNIVRMQNGKWAAVFGNGYNSTEVDGSVSTNGDAYLYVVDIADGSLIRKINTAVGANEDPSGLGRANGLSTVTPIDLDGDSVADYVYGGDLFGNLWKFNVLSVDQTKWKRAYSTRPLFTAKTLASGGQVQPITVRPQVIRHPTEKGQIVLFGTGKYFEVGDNSSSSQDNQTFYAIWDRNTLTASQQFTRGELLQQSITKEVTENGFEYRIISNNPLSKWYQGGTKPGAPATDGYLGWYMDLYNLQDGVNANGGERQISDPIIRNGKIIFTTLVPPPPSADVCGDEGSGWLMELDAITGGSLPVSPFDVNGDGVFDESDYLANGTDADGNPIKNSAGGRKSKVGFIPTPAILSDPGGAKEYKYTSGSTGAVEVTVENPGVGEFSRQSWRRLIKE